jgi:hypothetical protein
MPNDSFPFVKKMTRAGALLALCLAVSAFFPYQPALEGAARGRGNCNPEAGVFHGYTFLHPDIINKNSAYAPFFVKWDDYYERYYFARDVQEEENIEEWRARFCSLAAPEDVRKVIYESDEFELAGLHLAAADPKKKTPLPYRLGGNVFAQVIAYNGCTEVTAYLTFAKKCEEHVVARGDKWTPASRNTPAMLGLVQEGLGRFKDTESHFLRLRYAYQIVRLAHYAGDWQYTVDLYNYLIPKVDRRRPSIVYYWMLGHLAGALQRLGKYPEAAWRYSIVFRNCASKRAQAYRSFRIRNDQDWAQTLRLCESDAEKSTLFLMRAGGSHVEAVGDMQEVYALDPTNPQLDLLLVSDVQELEKIYLRTWVTDAKMGAAQGTIQRTAASKHLLDLTAFVRQVMREKETPNPKLWRAMDAYLELLAGDRYAAEKSFDRLENDLDDDSDYDQNLLKQLNVWRLLLDILNLNPAAENADDLAFRIRSYETFKSNPNFEPFLQDWLSAGYAASKHPGKAILAAYPPSALSLNPKLEVLDDLLKLADSDDPILLERTMQLDTNPDRIRAQLLEIKGAYLLGIGQPEAALAVLRRITPTEEARLPKFTPFREKVGEKIHRAVTDTLLLNRREIAQKIIDYDFRAKAAQAVDDPAAAWYKYLIGLAYYNMSYFGYEWEATDFYRSGYNQLRLAQGPYFSLRGSPDGNRENTDVSLALGYFEQALALAQNDELAAHAAFMAARCRQKQWFCSPECRYRPGSRLVPTLPDAYMTHYNTLIAKYSGTKFYGQIVKECKWLEAYAR